MRRWHDLVSDAQHFFAGGCGEAIADINARHGNEPGVSSYTHVSDQYGPYATRVIAATAGEAPYVRDELIYHQSGLHIDEHFIDTGGSSDHVFGLRMSAPWRADATLLVSR